MSPSALHDAHVHSHFSSDGRDSVSALCRAAQASGLAGLTITDHFDLEPSDPGYGWYDFDRLERAVAQARREYGDGLSLLIGAEVCFQPAFEEHIAHFLCTCPLDFVLGGVHYIRHEFVGPEYVGHHPAAELYDGYLEAVEAMVASGLFDALAHLDGAKRYGIPAYGPFDPSPYTERIDRILRRLIAQGMALEINTSGWRQPPQAPYPDEAILRRYRELGGERITFGSDAHEAADVGSGFQRAMDLARRLGFAHLTRYVRRQPRLIPL